MCSHKDTEYVYEFFAEYEHKEDFRIYGYFSEDTKDALWNQLYPEKPAEWFVRDIRDNTIPVHSKSSATEIREWVRSAPHWLEPLKHKETEDE